ncbi:MAG: tRNA preQ1(34) S-adenosylmethionine ribosyltransferase-isomerase QueA [Peptostreptococcaceae bacterium]|nr:tRNA preQ1(34) S-adenosylmethionine ribosyltransferase-isomerase QueA [Peptostreptococcaceae bacterium]
MNKSDFYYELPESFIAQEPLSKRDESKLMILDRKTGEIEHGRFKDVVEYLNSGDCLVLNNTRVIPARIFGKKTTGAEVEFLLLKRLDINRWQTLVKPGRRAKPGSVFEFGNGELRAEVLDVAEGGTRIIEFTYEGVFEEILEKLGRMPLPPYIMAKLEDQERYQTVYSKESGSAASPTAGLHFTEDLLVKIMDKGIEIAYVTLHIGLGTFRPVKEELIEDHEMHSEYYVLDEENADRINRAKKNGNRVIAVGTTANRVVETLGNESGLVCSGSGWTNIFIYPGYRFKVIDAIITNFHLPESTLIMLVSAFVDRETILEAYETAKSEGYRFFSFGDAMFIY